MFRLRDSQGQTLTILSGASPPLGKSFGLRLCPFHLDVAHTAGDTANVSFLSFLYIVNISEIYAFFSKVSFMVTFFFSRFTFKCKPHYEHFNTSLHQIMFTS